MVENGNLEKRKTECLVGFVWFIGDEGNVKLDENQIFFLFVRLVKIEIRYNWGFEKIVCDLFWV